MKQQVKHSSAAIPFYRKVLIQEFGRRQEESPRFSLRSYAKILDLQPPTLSAILSGKRHLPSKYGSQISDKLMLSPIQKQRFLRSVRRGNRIDHGSDTFFEAATLKEENHFKIISQWEHFAILSLMESSSFVSTHEFIADRLAITPKRAEECVRNLIEADLLYRNEKNELSKKQADVKTSEDVLSPALKQSHVDSMSLAKSKLESLSVDQRDYSSGTILMSKDKMAQAKMLIRDFRRNFYDLLEDGEGEDVFHICIQFFPLTQLEKQNEN